MRLVFKSGSVEKFLVIFIKEGKNELPQHVIIDQAGSGGFYLALNHLKDLGVIEESRCFSEQKMMMVKCVKLTEKGKRVVSLLREIRRVVLGE